MFANFQKYIEAPQGQDYVRKMISILENAKVFEGKREKCVNYILQCLLNSYGANYVNVSADADYYGEHAEAHLHIILRNIKEKLTAELFISLCGFLGALPDLECLQGAEPATREILKNQLRELEQKEEELRQEALMEAKQQGILTFNEAVQNSMPEPALDKEIGSEAEYQSLKSLCPPHGISTASAPPPADFQKRAH